MKLRRNHHHPESFGFPIRIAVFAILVSTGCADSTGPVPTVAGDWLGGLPNQLGISVEQFGSSLHATGQLARAGTYDSYGLAVEGWGTIMADSTVMLPLTVSFTADEHVLEARLLPDQTISGIIYGSRIDGVQSITLARTATPVWRSHSPDY